MSQPSDRREVYAEQCQDDNGGDRGANAGDHNCYPIGEELRELVRLRERLQEDFALIELVPHVKE